MEVFAAVLPTISNLKKLDVSVNFLMEKHIKVLAEGIMKMPSTLDVLSIAGNTGLDVDALKPLEACRIYK